MYTLARLLLWLVPHFRTLHYLNGHHKDTGEPVSVLVPRPQDLPEDLQDAVQSVSVLVLLGTGYFPRYSHYRP